MENKMGQLLAGMGIIGLVITLFAWLFLWPLAVIWALNTLFALGIGYTFWNWLAMMVLVSFFGKPSLNTNKD
jgi:hypothetical protein